MSKSKKTISPRSRPDDGLRALIVSNLREYRGETIMWQSIETAMTATGVPDLYGCWRGQHVWIECKATQHWRVKMDEFQVGWLVRLARAGGRGFVAVRRRLAAPTARREAFDELWMVLGANAPGLRAVGLTSWGTVFGTTAPEQWYWEKIAGVLFEPRG